jgi:hypothetical protein
MKTYSSTYRLQEMWSVQLSSLKGGDPETNRKVQYPVYFISEVLSDSKTRYLHIMKLAYTLLITSRKLSHYFQAHQIEVHMSLTLGKILNNREATGKIGKWVIELSMYDIIYKPGTAIKAQALSDFCGRVDRDSNTSKGNRVGVLDYQLRWVLVTSRSRSRNYGNIF